MTTTNQQITEADVLAFLRHHAAAITKRHPVLTGVKVKFESDDFEPVTVIGYQSGCFRMGGGDTLLDAIAKLRESLESEEEILESKRAELAKLQKELAALEEIEAKKREDSQEANAICAATQ